ncbi:MAG: hypothetical protein RI924_776 [Bacteroidota bacterium]|jgi:phosphoribosyl-ATP pyrophosphohydrolase/phosphoribosyl-AMP cyclohydrolase
MSNTHQMKPDFSKGLLPVIVQDASTQQVLMLGYMNEEAYQQTLTEQRVTFFSRSKNRLWTKGERSGNFLELQSVQLDCDQDSLLIRAKALGSTCHTGAISCFGESESEFSLAQLEKIIAARITAQDSQSYTFQLFQKGINKIAQKVGEEAVELVIEAKDDHRELFVNEAADLLYHFLVLLKAKGLTLADVNAVLSDRHQQK